MAGSNPQSLDLVQSQRLATRLSKQQLRFVRLLELNAPEFEEAVDQEIQSNPALEPLDQTLTHTRDDDDDDSDAWERSLWRPQASSYASPTASQVTPADSPTLYDHLLAQLGEKQLPEQISKAARFLVESLDSNGYLRTPLSQLAVDMAVNENLDLPEDQLQEALETVKSLDPAGVGAKDLRESLLLQLEAIEKVAPDYPSIRDALRIISEQYEEFALKHYDQLAKNLQLSPEEVQQAMERILQLNPKPGAQFEARSDAASNFIVPDFILDETDGQLSIGLPNRIPELAVSQSFTDGMKTVRQDSKHRRKGTDFVADRVADAKEFLKMVSERQNTLLTVASAILKIQKEYFQTRDLYRLRPMMIKDITALTGYDASVISRATAGKYLQTPWGIFPMRFFFSDTVGENGTDTGALTNRKLEAEIKDLVEKEDKRRPLSDDKLQKALAAKGYEISRRTIAKYRDRLGLPVARLRKQ